MGRDHKLKQGSRHTERLGRITKKTRGGYTVSSERGTVLCEVSGRLSRPSTLAVAVGDEVRFDDVGTDRGIITAVMPRRNRLSRRAAGAKPVEQVIAANVDQMMAVFAAAQPAPKWRMLDRYLVSAEAAGIPASICITKTDLVDVDRMRRDLGHYERIGYPVLLVSALRGTGMDRLRVMLQGRSTVLVGKSGVGKTTLLNALQPGLGLRVAEVSRRGGKGRHTTTHVELFELAFGGGVIDTPGAREFALWDVDDRELAALFPEMRPQLERCRFAGACTHTHEMGCAIKDAVEAGRIDPRRYNSYVRMLGRGDAHRKHSADDQRQSTNVPDGFTCNRCGWEVVGEAVGTEHRNHCPRCLWSRHLDVQPGDRAAGCGGDMEPIAIWVRGKGEWAIIHRCQDCGAVRSNRVAGDDNEMALLSLAVRALAQPPFPLDRLAATKRAGP